MEQTIEQIKAEIERLIKQNEAYLDDNLKDYALAQKTGAYSVLNDLLHFINSLPEEPVSKDLKEASKNYADSITEKIGYNLQLRRAVCYGAQWQKEQIKKSMDLDEPPYLVSVEQAYYITKNLLEE